MTDEELQRLIAEGEGPYLDFKDARVRPSTLARTLVAFANTGGGRVVVGVDETTRTPTGISNREETLDNPSASSGQASTVPPASIAASPL